MQPLFCDAKERLFSSLLGVYTRSPPRLSSFTTSLYVVQSSVSVRSSQYVFGRDLAANPRLHNAHQYDVAQQPLTGCWWHLILLAWGCGRLRNPLEAVLPSLTALLTTFEAFGMRNSPCQNVCCVAHHVRKDEYGSWDPFLRRKYIFKECLYLGHCISTFILKVSNQ